MFLFLFNFYFGAAERGRVLTGKKAASLWACKVSLRLSMRLADKRGECVGLIVAPFCWAQGPFTWPMNFFGGAAEAGVVCVPVFQPVTGGALSLQKRPLQTSFVGEGPELQAGSPKVIGSSLPLGRLPEVTIYGCHCIHFFSFFCPETCQGEICCRAHLTSARFGQAKTSPQSLAWLP